MTIQLATLFLQSLIRPVRLMKETLLRLLSLIGKQEKG